MKNERKKTKLNSKLKKHKYSTAIRERCKTIRPYSQKKKIRGNVKCHPPISIKINRKIKAKSKRIIK